MAGRNVWVAGFPGYWGGADTELDHLIDLWRAHGVAVHLVPMFGSDPAMVASVLARGCTVHEYRPEIFRDRVVVSFCNQNFLGRLPEIVAAGRPGRVIWFNCMTWLFDGDRRAHEEGWIDLFGFVSEYQERCLAPELGEYRTFGYRPYFDVARVPWAYREWDGSYHVGRVSRDNASKYAPDTWRIFNRVLVPPELRKRVLVLGFGPRARERTGLPPPGLEVETWPCNGIPAEHVYRRLDTMIHKTGSSRESYGRVLVEAHAYGVVPIVEDDYAFPELVIDGETGFRTSDSDEMSYLASVLAHDPARHRRMAENGRRHLEETLVDAEACWAAWATVL
jgi:glycosyltransferase involved in cell wall biosynthesis